MQEAEALYRRALEIFLQFTRDTGHEHTNLRAAASNYTSLLIQMGYSEKQLRARLHALAAPYGLSLDTG
jgi:hypothetical protein